MVCIATSATKVMFISIFWCLLYIYKNSSDLLIICYIVHSIIARITAVVPLEQHLLLHLIS